MPEQEKTCLTCGNCTDVFWDFMHGPYMFVCVVGADTCNGARGCCPMWKKEAASD